MHCCCYAIGYISYRMPDIITTQRVRSSCRKQAKPESVQHDRFEVGSGSY